MIFKHSSLIPALHLLQAHDDTGLREHVEKRAAYEIGLAVIKHFRPTWERVIDGEFCHFRIDARPVGEYEQARSDSEQKGYINGHKDGLREGKAQALAAMQLHLRKVVNES